MWNRFRRWFGLAAAVFALAGLTAEQAGARGGGGGGGGRGGRGGRSGGGRSGGMGGGRGGGRGGKGKGAASGKSAKEWELLRDQEARLEMIKQRRERLMDLDRKMEQEAWLADKRVKAADMQSRTGDVR